MSMEKAPDGVAQVVGAPTNAAVTINDTGDAVQFTVPPLTLTSELKNLYGKDGKGFESLTKVTNFIAASFMPAQPKPDKNAPKQQAAAEAPPHPNANLLRDLQALMKRKGKDVAGVLMFVLNHADALKPLMNLKGSKDAEALRNLMTIARRNQPKLQNRNEVKTIHIGASPSQTEKVAKIVDGTPSGYAKTADTLLPSSPNRISLKTLTAKSLQEDKPSPKTDTKRKLIGSEITALMAPHPAGL